ncbi:MAG: OadG family protein [Lachnospiraceae bacterium]|nr:OadG family protein [Lachnospiraceae bacterium]
MKKILTMLCMLTCLLGLTACGEEQLTQLEINRGETAANLATDFMIPYMTYFFDDARAEQYQNDYGVEELKYVTEQQLNYAMYVFSTQYGLNYGVDEITVEGNAVLNAIVSFNGAYHTMGDIDTSSNLVGTYRYSNDKKTIIVTVPVTGSVTNSKGEPITAEAEIIFSNDLFLTVESCSLNIERSMGELMGRAAMDTLMGMGTVFSVLILISLVIWALGGIPKLQEKLSKKNKAEVKSIQEESVDNTIAQIIENEEQQGDDCELAAVIAAAIAAYEGSVSTDGFVVRSIRKRR